MNMYNRIPPFKWFVLQNFPFIEEDFDAITNYQLLCKIVEYLNSTIKKTNDLGIQVEKLTNWFNNLDVQDEIDNKLDEMAESGQLTDIIAQYLQLAGVLAFNNVNDMKNATNLVNGSIVKTLGFYSYNDGGGAFYKIRTMTNQDIINNIDIFAITNSNDLIAELIYNNEINVLQIGCKSDDSEDISSIINIATQKANLFFPAGIYNVSNPLVLKNNIRSNYHNTDITFDGTKDAILKSHIVNNLTGESNPTMSVINISTVNFGFEMKNIFIRCNSNENGIYGYFNYANRITIHHITIINVQNAIGLFINSSEYISRIAYLSDIVIFGTNETYANSTGIKILTSGDNRINNLGIMGCQKGFVTNVINYGSNWHIWCGPLQGHDENDWWAETRGIDIVEGIFDNIYLDSCFISIVGNNKQYQMISNLITMNDSSMAGSDSYDSSVVYNFKGTINNWELNLDDRTLYPIGEDGKYTNVQMISRNDNALFSIPKLYGSRYSDVNYSFRNIPAENKLIEVAKIYCDNTSGSVILNVFHANVQYAKIKLKFANGSFDSFDIIENVGTDNYYITSSKTNNIYTVYIDCHSNFNEWIGVNIEKGVQMNTLNAIDLNIQMENRESYVPNKISYDSNILDTLI